MKPRRLLILFCLFTLSVAHSLAFALDHIPEDMSGWTEKGAVLKNGSGISWERKNGIGVAGVSKVNGMYYLFYLAGFNGCWNADGDVNHQSLGLATSTDGVNFSKYSGNPVLKPHNFVSVESHEEGIRAAFIRYIPSKNKFYGYFGVESPGGSGGCQFGGGGSCGCDVNVDSQVYLATSDDGRDWELKGAVNGTYGAGGHEVYASGWVYNGSQFGMYVTVAQGGDKKFASRGFQELSLNELGSVNALNWGWSGLDTYLHDDNNTITLIYNPNGGGHPGSSNDKLYFSTTHLNNMTKIQNERVVSSKGEERNIIFRDGNEWKWYYSDEPGWNRTEIKLRTHPIVNGDKMPPAPPIKVSAP